MECHVHHHLINDLYHLLYKLLALPHYLSIPNNAENMQPMKSGTCTQKLVICITFHITYCSIGMCVWSQTDLLCLCVLPATIGMSMHFKFTDSFAACVYTINY